MPTSFQFLSEILEKIENTRKRLEIIALTANYLKTLDEDEVQAAVDMTVSRAFTKYSQQTLDVNCATLSRMLGR